LKARGKITIDEELCKSCGFCVEYCPQQVIGLADHYNTKGYYPAVLNSGDCTGCGICALVCPEAAIEVWRE
jgi:2-oxoglutarate ferredoxin oxidoreductase subunit delta